MWWNLRLHTAALAHPDHYKSWFCVHLKALFTLSPGLCLLEKFVLLVSPCDEEMKKYELWTRLCSSWCWNFTVHALSKSVCICGSLSRVFKCSSSLCRCFTVELKLWWRNKTGDMTVPLHLRVNSIQLWAPYVITSVCSYVPLAPPPMHLSSWLPSDVVLCTHRLCISCPTSCVHWPISLSAPGPCPHLCSSLSRFLSLSLCNSSGTRQKEWKHVLQAH